MVLQADVNGHSFQYTEETLFEIQKGEGRRAYDTVNMVRGNLTQAIADYLNLPIEKGEKKRLVAHAGSHPVIARKIFKG